LVTDLNTARPITSGGTGATTAAAARTALGVALAQTSVTDTTAGSGLIVGGHGIGGAGVSPGTGLNGALYTGTYSVDATTENTPDTQGPDGSQCIVTRDSATDVQQVLLRRGSVVNNIRMYLRQMRESAWGSWAEVFTTYNLLGTVSQSSGVPTGSVIERGSNGNGEYVRFADGTQICTQTFSIDISTGEGYQAKTFAAAFTHIHGASWSCGDTPASSANKTCLGNAFVSVSTSGWSWYNPGTGFAGSTVSIRLTAVGRWV
jgi:hypothetical protein